MPPLLELETCWWVPLLFGVAGVILGVGFPVLDDLRRARDPQVTVGSHSPEKHPTVDGKWGEGV